MYDKGILNILVPGLSNRYNGVLQGNSM